MTAVPASPQSICLLRLSALGDVCNCVALVNILRATWPRSRITWLIGRTEHRLVEDLPGVDFIVCDKKAGWTGVGSMRRALSKQRFDVLLHAQVSARSNLIAALVRADRRIGFDRQRAREGHGLVARERIAAVPGQHQALAFLEFARALGLATDNADRRPPIPESAETFARAHQPDPGRAVLISPASSHALRNWHPAGYAEVADWVARDAGRPVFLVGGPSARERELGEAIEAEMTGQATNLIGRDTLKESLAMLDRAACLISPDSGPAHFAAALGTPVVGLYAATWSRRSGPLGSLEHCVDRFPDAARRFLGREPEQLRWGQRVEKPGVMDLIKPQEVIERLQNLLIDRAEPDPTGQSRRPSRP
jgi:heptosyltransferase I